MYCSRHCKDNVRQYMTKLGVDLATRESVLALLFSCTGLAASSDQNTFDQRECEVLQYVRTKNLNLDDYFINRIIPKLQQNCQTMWQESWLGKNLWTNNNCESANHLLKLELDWKPVRVSDLVAHLHDMVKLQYKNVARAMCGQGDFHLAEAFCSHRQLFSGIV